MKLRGLAQWVWRNLTTRYLIGLGTIGVLAAAAQFTIQNILTTTEADHRNSILLENRLLQVQTISRTLNRILLASTPLERQQTLREVIETAMEIKSIDEKMLDLSKRASNERIQEVLQEIVEKHDVFYKSVEKLEFHSSSKSKLLFQGQSALQEAIAQNQEIMEQLKSASLQLQLDQTSRLEGVKRVEVTLFLLILVLLAFEAVFVFRPTVEKMSATVADLELAQKQLVEQKEKIEESLGIRSEFIGRMSHEIRNPLNTIQGMTDLMFETAKDADQRRYLQTVRRASRTLLSFVNDILDFSKMGQGEIILSPEEFDVLPLLETATDLVSIQAEEKGIELVLDYQLPLGCRMHSDRKRLQQVLLNLLQNAVKFTDQGSVILHASLKEALIEFAVLDTGVGIPEQLRAKVFESFFQVDSSRTRKAGGTGLGLSISKALVNKMGGQIWLEANPSESSGSAFRIEMPVGLVASSPEQDSPLESVMNAKSVVYWLSSRNKTESVYAGNFQKAFRRWVRVDSGESLLQHLERQKGNESCYVVMDESEAFKDGLIASLTHLPVTKAKFAALLSLNGAHSRIDECQKRGFQILFKPLKPSEFIEFLSSTTDRPEVMGIKKEKRVFGNVQPNARFLVVDDTPENHLVMDAFLKPYSGRIEHAYHGVQALDEFKAKPFDMVFMDIQMPKMDGLEATRLIRAYERESSRDPIPVVAVTAVDDPLELRLAQEAGCSERLTKPISQALLHEILAKYLQAGGVAAKIEITPVHPALKDAVPGYLEKRFVELEEMKGFFDQGSFTDLQRSGHKIRGNAATYGFPGLTELGKQLESAAGSQDRATVEKLLKEMGSYLVEAKAEISKGISTT